METRRSFLRLLGLSSVALMVAPSMLLRKGSPEVNLSDGEWHSVAAICERGWLGNWKTRCWLDGGEIRPSSLNHRTITSMIRTGGSPVKYRVNIRVWNKVTHLDSFTAYFPDIFVKQNLIQKVLTS